MPYVNKTETCLKALGDFDNYLVQHNVLSKAKKIAFKRPKGIKS